MRKFKEMAQVGLMRISKEMASKYAISRTVSRFDFISGTVMPGGPGKKPIVLCRDPMHINRVGRAERENLKKWLVNLHAISRTVSWFDVISVQ